MQSNRSTMAETSEFHAACAVLGLSTATSLSEAKTAFRVRAALLHPDVHQGAGTHRMNAATAAMQQLSDAYRLVAESLIAGDPNATNVTQGHIGMTHRCTNCRSEFQYTANDALVACPRCGQGFRVRSRNRRSYSRGRFPRVVWWPTRDVLGHGNAPSRLVVSHTSCSGTTGVEGVGGVGLLSIRGELRIGDCPTADSMARRGPRRGLTQAIVTNLMRGVRCWCPDRKGPSWRLPVRLAARPRNANTALDHDVETLRRSSSRPGSESCLRQ